MKHFMFMASALLASATLLTACNDDNDEPLSPELVTFSFTVDADNFNSDGYWKEVYNTEINNLGIYSENMRAGAIFTHHASADEWDGVVYHSYVGFCPSRVNDRIDHGTDAYWTDFQWGTIAPTTAGQSYLVAHWDVQETEATALKDRSCGVDLISPCNPQSISVANTTWGYWAMKNGSSFSKAFGAADWCLLTIHGIASDGTEKTVPVYLAKNGSIEDGWINVDLRALGKVQSLYFTMSSSDSGQWGMNNPAYFALSGMNILYNAD